MPMFISQGRYSENAVKAMLARPEDRAAPVAKLVQQAGGTLVDFYLLFGEDDWMIIYEAPSGQEAAAVMLAVAGSGAVTNTRTTLAMTTVEAKSAFQAAQRLTDAYQKPGQG